MKFLTFLEVWGPGCEDVLVWVGGFWPKAWWAYRKVHMAPRSVSISHPTPQVG